MTIRTDFIKAKKSADQAYLILSKMQGPALYCSKHIPYTVFINYEWDRYLYKLEKKYPKNYITVDLCNCGKFNKRHTGWYKHINLTFGESHMFLPML
jgi:hypothetical protein